MGPRVRRLLAEAVRIGEALGERGLTADASVALTQMRLLRPLRRPTTRSGWSLRGRLPSSRARGRGRVGRGLGLAGQLQFWAGDSAGAIDDLERSAEHARNAGDRLQESISLNYVLIASLHGPTPVTVALKRIDRCAAGSR
jgi:hypothetical protein